MEHQDWTPVYIRANKYLDTKKKGEKTEGEQTEGDKINHFSKENKIDKKIEEGKLKHDKTPAEFGKLVQARRLSQNMTQKDLAQRLNLPVKTINEIECGKAKHNPQVVSKIKRILNISNK